VSRLPELPLRGEGEEESANLIDYPLLRQRALFVLHGLRRHRLLAAATFAVVVAVGVTVAWGYPRTYHVESRLLANRTQLLRALGNPRSGLPNEDPTRAAQETIFGRDNLVSLIKQTGLVEAWEATRHPALRLKDRVNAVFSGPVTADDTVEMMVGTLEKKLNVTTDGVTVTITVDWPDARLAYQIVETAQQNFLETRHVTEMSAISEALSILEVHASQVQRGMEDALAELERVRDARQRGQAAPALESPLSAADFDPPRPERTASQLATEQELAQIRFLIQSKKRAIVDLEDFRARRLSELNSKLTEQRVEFADKHPAIVDTLDRIAAVKQESPQLAALRSDVHELTAEYTRKGGVAPDAMLEPPLQRRSLRARPITFAARAALSSNDLADDPTVEHARENLRMVTAKYEELMMRIDAAKIELDTARAAFKYRYTVVRPASVPTHPSKPNVPALLLVTLVVALGTALLGGTALDLWRGRLVEAWQVERVLRLRVLGEVKRP